MTDTSFDLRPIGWVESPLVDLAAAPRQGDEGAPDASIRFDPAVSEALEDIGVGDELIVLTWLHLADRHILAVHPRGDERNPLTGVFSTRSADRPNPIGLHRVEVISVDHLSVRVRRLEAVDGTPVIDVKPVLEPIDQR
jgi:tRNA-Thr(GGU) m(6)t(6)A37 methyltransferase TsaA